LTFFINEIYCEVERMKASVGAEELAQFDLLEQKVVELISLVIALRKEKKGLEEQVKRQEETIASFTSEVEALRADRQLVREKIVAILEKIEACKE
jgi:septal ring factor EnvC (AmiA/AmiB activator)